MWFQFYDSISEKNKNHSEKWANYFNNHFPQSDKQMAKKVNECKSKL